MPTSAAIDNGLENVPLLTCRYTEPLHTFWNAELPPQSSTVTELSPAT